MAKGRALTPMGVILKWILIPTGLAAMGFFLIGAKVGNYLPGAVGEKSDAAASTVADAAPSSNYSAPSVNVRSDPRFSRPEVEVSSHRKPKMRRKRSNPLPGESTSSAAQAISR